MKLSAVPSIPALASPRPSPILRNATALVAAQVVIKAVNLLVSLAMVRWLGAHELGRYAYIVAFCFPFGALADFGLATLAVREMSRAPARERAVVATLRPLLVALGAAAGLAMLAVAWLTSHDPATLLGVAVVGAGNLIGALTTPYLVALTAREEMHRLSLHRISASVLGSLATLAVLLTSGGVLSLLLAAAGTNLVMLAVGRGLAGRLDAPGPVPATACAAMLRQALPFGVLMVAFALYYRVDMVMLRWLADARQVGLYAAGYRFLDAVVVLAAALGGPYFPRLASLGVLHPGDTRDLLAAAWRPLLALGLPLTLGTALLADELAVALFGPEFRETGGLLRILAGATIALFWVNPANFALIAADRVWALAGVYGLAAAINVAANALLIPAWGARGASVATLGSEWLALGLVLLLVRRVFGAAPGARGLGWFALAGLGLALAVHLGRPHGLMVAVGAGGLAYAGVLFAAAWLGHGDVLPLGWLRVVRGAGRG
jgi:O-antigen/teichoic acid export membrane protein